MSPLWPRKPWTAGALVALALLQVAFFFAVTEPSFFATDDYYNFQLAQERGLLRYLLSPVLHVYPAPGHRLTTLLLQTLSPLDYSVARLVLIAFLVGATIFLVQVMRTIVRSEQPWTVALAVPFALSVTAVHPVMWWSNGAQVVPSLLFTAVALAAWLRSYIDERWGRWTVVSAVAVAAAGLFSIKFLLIPLYLLFIRLWIVPRMLDVPGGLRSLWKERIRWVAIGIAPAVYLAVFVLSGLWARGVAGGSGPYAEYLALSWFGGFAPASMLNARLTGEESPLVFWGVVASSQIIFWAVALSTARRSSLAVRGWGLFLLAFVANVAMVASSRLSAFGVGVAYELRYYPEVLFFLPVALALAVRGSQEPSGSRPVPPALRRPLRRAGIVAAVSLYAVSFLVWAPRLVNDWDGVRARAWFENLRNDVQSAKSALRTPRIVDSETPDYVMPDWLRPHNRVSTVLGLIHSDLRYNELSASTYLVREDGHLAEAVFRPLRAIVAGGTVAEGVTLSGPIALSSAGVCLRNKGSLSYRSHGVIAGRHLSLRAVYSTSSPEAASLEVDVGEGDPRFHRLQAVDRRAELFDLGTSSVRELIIRGPRHQSFCIERADLGALDPGNPIPPSDP